MKCLTSYLTPPKTKSFLKPCMCVLHLCEAGFCSGKVNVVQMSYAPPAACAVHRNGILALEKAR